MFSPAIRQAISALSSWELPWEPSLPAAPVIIIRRISGTLSADILFTVRILLPMGLTAVPLTTELEAVRMEYRKRRMDRTALRVAAHLTTLTLGQRAEPPLSRRHTESRALVKRITPTRGVMAQLIRDPARLRSGDNPTSHKETNRRQHNTIQTRMERPLQRRDRRVEKPLRPRRARAIPTPARTQAATCTRDTTAMCIRTPGRGGKNPPATVAGAM